VQDSDQDGLVTQSIRPFSPARWAYISSRFNSGVKWAWHESLEAKDAREILQVQSPGKAFTLVLTLGRLHKTEISMQRVLALPGLPEAYFGDSDEMDSNLSNICSSETTKCSTQSNQCGPATVTGGSDW